MNNYMKFLSFPIMLAALSANAQKNNPVEEVVVTGTKRDQALQDVPSSVNVLTESDIAEAGIKRPKDFLATVPNVTFIEDNAGEVYVNIRGQTAVRNSDPNVAVVIDGVPLVSLKAFNQDLFDIQQIEVLKGPQSAVYGRNAAAGAIVITTKQPGDETEGSMSAGMGNFGSSRMSVGLSGPFSDELKFALSAATRETDGPFTNQLTGEKVQRYKTSLGRLRLFYNPNDDTSVNFRLAAHDSKGGGTAYNGQFAGVPIGGVPVPALDANLMLPFVSNVAGFSEEEMLDMALDVERQLDFGSIRSITSLNSFDQTFGGDGVPYIADSGAEGALTQMYTYDDEVFSQEFRVSSNADGRIQWMAGVYFLQFKRDQISELNQDVNGTLLRTRGVDGPDTIAPTASYTNSEFETTNYAVFANMQMDLSDRLTLELAGRYDVEKREVTEKAPEAFNLCVQAFSTPLSACNDSTTFRNFSPKVSLIYLAGDDLTLYANYGKGYKSGGYNPLGSRQALITAGAGAGVDESDIFVQDQFEEEVSESFELGAKGKFFDQRLSVNIGIFHTVVEGAQQFEFFPSAGLQTVTSIDEVELKGFDVDFTALLPSEYEVFGGYGFTDGEVTEFAANPSFEGNTAPGSVKTTATLGVTKTFELSNGLSLTPRLEVTRYGSIWWDVANTPGTERDPVTIVDGRLTLAEGAQWEVALWGKNLTDEEYYQEVVPLLGVLSVNYRAPTRSYGVDFTYHF
jgi:iron complex outermembrane receptor protein